MISALRANAAALEADRLVKTNPTPEGFMMESDVPAILAKRRMGGVNLPRTEGDNFALEQGAITLKDKASAAHAAVDNEADGPSPEVREEDLQPAVVETGATKRIPAKANQSTATAQKGQRA